MKKFIATGMMLCCMTALFAQAVPAGWTTDYYAALKQAKAEKKNVLILFTGSDWCSWCKLLKKNTLDKSSFKRYAKENLVTVYFDFPYDRKISQRQMGIQQSLAKTFGVEGFPTTVVVAPDGRKLLQFSGYRDADNYIKELESIKK